MDSERCPAPPENPGTHEVLPGTSHPLQDTLVLSESAKNADSLKSTKSNQKLGLHAEYHMFDRVGQNDKGENELLTVEGK